MAVTNVIEGLDNYRVLPTCEIADLGAVGVHLDTIHTGLGIGD